MILEKTLKNREKCFIKIEKILTEIQNFNICFWIELKIVDIISYDLAYHYDGGCVVCSIEKAPFA